MPGPSHLTLSMKSMNGSACSSAIGTDQPKALSLGRVRRAKKIRTESTDAPGNREAIAAELAVHLPADKDSILLRAKAAVAAFDAAVMVGDLEAARRAESTYDATVWKLNGGTFFGCQSDDAAGTVIARFCAARPGEVPGWGQAGEFLIQVDGVRSLVDVPEGIGGFMRGHFAFHVVDLDGPYISETGYRSHFDQVRVGMRVDEVAVLVFTELLKSSRRYLEPAAQHRLAAEPARSILSRIEPAARRIPCVESKQLESESLPPGYVLVDAVLTAHQAFIVKKWAAAARSKMQKTRQNA